MKPLINSRIRKADGTSVKDAWDVLDMGTKLKGGRHLPNSAQVVTLMTKGRGELWDNAVDLKDLGKPTKMRVDETITPLLH